MGESIQRGDGAGLQIWEWGTKKYVCPSFFYSLMAPVTLLVHKKLSIKSLAHISQPKQCHNQWNATPINNPSHPHPHSPRTVCATKTSKNPSDHQNLTQIPGIPTHSLPSITWFPPSSSPFLSNSMQLAPWVTSQRRAVINELEREGQGQPGGWKGIPEPIDKGSCQHLSNMPSPSSIPLLPPGSCQSISC